MTSAIRQLAVSPNGTELYLTTHTSGNTIIVNPPGMTGYVIMLPNSVFWTHPENYTDVLDAHIEAYEEGEV
jgi:hypothetical protein